MNLLTGWKLYCILSKDIAQGEHMNAQKPGWKTTEFWLTILAQVPAVVGIFAGAANPITIGISAAATIAYTLCRSFSKANGAAVALAALQAGAQAAAKLPAVAVPPPAPAAIVAPPSA